MGWVYDDDDIRVRLMYLMIHALPDAFQNAPSRNKSCATFNGTERIYTRPASPWSSGIDSRRQVVRGYVVSRSPKSD